MGSTERTWLRGRGARPFACATLATALWLGALPARTHAESAIDDCGARQTAPFARAWTGFKGGCPTSLGLSAYAGATDKVLQWRSSLSFNPTFPGQVAAPPVIGPNGNVYVGTNEGYLYGVSRLGSRLWQTNLYGRIRAAATIGADGTIYAVSDFGALFAIDPNTGFVKWTHLGDLVEPLYSSPTIGPDGTIFYADYDGWVYAVRPDGSRKWVRNMLGRVAASPVLSRDGATLYIGNEQFVFRALNAQTGATQWITPVLTGDTATAAISHTGNIYVATTRGFVHALQPNGTPIWTYPLPFFAPVHASVAVAPNGDVIVADVFGTVYAIRNTGGLRWSRNLGGRISSTPAVDSAGNIFIGTGGNFHFTWGIFGTILPGVNALHALNGTTGATIWQYATLGGVASSPAISAVGSIYVGDDLGYLYMVGTQINGQNARPSWPEDAVLRTPATLLPATIDVKPPGCADPTTRFTFHKTSVAGVPDVIDHLSLANPACGGHLCGLTAERADNDYTQPQVTASTELQMFTAPSDSNPSNTSLPAPATLGCSAIAAPATCPIDPATVNLTVQCTLDADCGTAGLPSTFRCASVCLNAAGTALDISTAGPCPNQTMRCGAPFASGALACAANALPAVTTTTVPPNPLSPPVRDPAYQNYRCIESRECAEDGALMAPWTAQCVNPAGATVNCSASQNGLQGPVTVTNVPTSFQATDFFNRSDFLNTKCALNQRGDTSAGKSARIAGSKDSTATNTKPNNWGVSFDPNFNAKIAPRARPFGRFDPGTTLSAEWRADGRAFGRSIPIFSIGGHANFPTLCDMDVGTSAQLFGQSVSIVVRNDTGATDPGFNTSAGKLACEDALTLTNKRFSELKSAMVEAQQIYKNLVVDRVKLTKEICLAALPGSITTPSICESASYNPPSPSIAASIVNAKVGDYNTRHGKITQYLNEEAASIATALSGVGLSDGGKRGYVKLLDLSQRFAVRVVEVRIPIGPVTVVLSIEGGGDWGLPGGLDYGVQFFESNGKMPGAYATADLTPAAGMNVDLYLGAGVSILGVAGADIGIGGTVRLIDVRTPILVSANLSRSTANPSGTPDVRLLLSDWGGSSPFTVKSRMPTYQWSAKTSMMAKTQMTLLSGQIDMRARVYFLLYSHTWKKLIAKLAGFTQEFPIVQATVGTDLPLVDVGNPLNAMPQVVFVNVPTATTSNFPGLNSWATKPPLATAPENQLQSLLANECYPEVL